LMLLYQVMESKQSVSDRFYQALYTKLLDPSISTTSRHTMLLNLLYKSIKADPTLKRVKSFIKRLLQMSIHENPSFACGILFLLSEILKINPGAKSLMTQPEGDDEEEHFVDIKDEGDSQEESQETVEKDGVDNIDKEKKSWTFIDQNKKTIKYQINHRNPLYTGAEQTCAWDVSSFTNHFHPSVVHFAKSVVNGSPIEYKGDPLQDFQLIRFLDRFMYRNPKKTSKEHGTSLMQQQKISSRLKEDPVNSKNFLRKPEEKVREDELFFYRFFKSKEQAISQDGLSENELSSLDNKDEADTMDDFDFAAEMEKSGKAKQKKGKKTDDDSDEENDTESDEDVEFDYDDLNEDFSDDDIEENFEDGPKKNSQKFTDKDYEDALFQNLDSDGESIASSDGEAEDMKGSNRKSASMFAAAEDFAHMLEDSGEKGKGKIHPKQQAWESRHENQRWRQKKQGRKRRGDFNKSKNRHKKART